MLASIRDKPPLVNILSCVGSFLVISASQFDRLVLAVRRTTRMVREIEGRGGGVGLGADL